MLMDLVMPKRSIELNSLQTIDCYLLSFSIAVIFAADKKNLFSWPITGGEDSLLFLHSACKPNIIQSNR